MPSVTTVLGKSPHFPQDWLQEWRERIGDFEADKIATQSRNRGQAIHELLQKYMMNDPNYSEGAMPVNLESFWKIQPYLNNSISLVYAVEFPLYSYSLDTAGTTDLICRWDGKRTVLDLKTARKRKTEENALIHFIQATCYGHMHNELFHTNPITHIAIIISVDDEEPQIFVKPITDYLSLMLDIFKKR